jgi:hypothetical protein
VFLYYTGFVVILAMLLGGHALVELVALPLLAWALFKLTPSQLGRGGATAIVLLCAILALPLFQLIPMPPFLWSSLPGRAEIAAAYDAAGMPSPWLPISLDPSATWFGLLSLLPAAAIFLAMLSLDQRARRILIMLVFVVILASVLLDMLQMVGGDNSPLRFYEITNTTAVGFFANANHNAAFLYSAIPFVTAWAIGLMLDLRRNRRLALAWLVLLMLMIIIGVALTRSRAGMALLFLAGLFSILLVWRHDRGPSGRRLVRIALGVYVVALLVAFQFGFAGLMERLEGGVAGDLRWPIAQVSSQAALANLPLGSGFGTFVPVYDKFAPSELLGGEYVNHAHDDWLELWLTGGVPAIVLAIGFLAWFAASTIRLWSSSDQPQAPGLDLVLARAAPMVIALLLLHSTVEYPLRSEALMVVFAIACAYLVPRRATQPYEIPAGVESYAPKTIDRSRKRQKAT